MTLGSSLLVPPSPSSLTASTPTCPPRPWLAWPGTGCSVPTHNLPAWCPPPAQVRPAASWFHRGESKRFMQGPRRPFPDSGLGVSTRLLGPGEPLAEECGHHLRVAHRQDAGGTNTLTFSLPLPSLLLVLPLVTTGHRGEEGPAHAAREGDSGAGRRGRKRGWRGPPPPPSQPGKFDHPPRMRSNATAFTKAPAVAAIGRTCRPSLC